MFDGNHRTKRNINLSGKNRRPRRPFHKTTTAGFASIHNSTSSNNNTAFSSSSFSNTTLPTTNHTNTSINTRAPDVPNTKAELLANARRLRRERLQKQKEIDSTISIQRQFRGWRARFHLMLWLDGDDYVMSSRSDIIPSRYVSGDDEVGGVGGGGVCDPEVMLRRVGRRLSPPLIGFLVVAKRRKWRSRCKERDSSMTLETVGRGGGGEKEALEEWTEEECLWNVVLSLHDAVTRSCSRQKTGTTQDKKSEDICMKQRALGAGRVFCVVIALLRRAAVDGGWQNRGNSALTTTVGYCKGKNSSEMEENYGERGVSGGDDDGDSYCDIRKRVEALLKLMEYLTTSWNQGGQGGMSILYNKENKKDGGTLEFFRSVWNSHVTSEIAPTVQSTAFLSPNKPVPTTNHTLLNDVRFYDTPSFVAALVSCFSIWFRFSLAVSDAPQKEQEEKEETKRFLFPQQSFFVASQLMEYTNYAVRAISSSRNSDNDNTDDDDDDDDDDVTISPLAAVILSAPNLEQVEAMYGNRLRTLLGHTNSKNNIFSTDDESNLYRRLVRSVTNVLTAIYEREPSKQPSSTKTTRSMKQIILSRSVRFVLSKGGDVLFLSNVLKLLPTAHVGGKDHDAFFGTTLRALNAVLLSGDNENGDCGTLGVLCALAAKGENVSSLISSYITNRDDSDGNDGMDGGEDMLVMEEDPMADEEDRNDDDVSIEVEEFGQHRGSGVRGIGSVGGAGTIESYSRAKRRFIARRQDLQTISKLDQMYQNKVADVRREVLTSLRSRLTSGSSRDLGMNHSTTAILQSLGCIATDVGGGNLLLLLAADVFRKGESYHRGSLPNGATISDAYVQVLSSVLQGCTSTKSKTSATSPLLSKLAFHSEFLEELWLYTKDALQKTTEVGASFSRKSCREGNDKAALDSATFARAYAAMTVFSDLFSHRLLALDDDEFLSAYADKNSYGLEVKFRGSSSSACSAIRAEDVVVASKDVLYDLYWSRPVRAEDIDTPLLSSCIINSYGHGDRREGMVEKQLNCQRGRLLLSGTKLWNALYERWTRLFRTAKFCDEECWLFPRLITPNRDEEGAVTASDAAIVVDDEDEFDMDVDLDGDVPPEDTTPFGGRTISSARFATAVDEENDALASSFRDPKMARILTSIPQALPFERRVKLFNSLRQADIARSQDESAAMRDMMINMQRGEEEADFTGRERVQIRRDAMYEDAMEQLNGLGRKLRKKVQVTFVNRHGADEAGIDGGGVFKEFLDDLIKDAFDPEARPFFSVSPTQTLRVNVGERTTESVLSHYEFLGRVLGKAVYESILVEPQFCLPFLNQLLGKQNTLDDLKNVDPEYYKQLSAVRRMEDSDINGMGLSFELTTRRSDGSNETVELIPGGSNLLVTKQNAIRYVHLVAHRRLNIETIAQTQAFLRGFRDLIPAAWVRLFSPYELQKLIGGDDSVKGFDVNGLKSVMQYGGGYHPSQITMQWFWEVVEEMSPERQRKLLKFMTSCSRQPLLGFQALSPQPCIHQVRLTDEEFVTNEQRGDARLPTSSTCMNLLKLPNYKSKETLKEKLVYAVEAGAGFELS